MIKDKTFVVTILEDCPRTGIKKDEQYIAKVYWLDPQEKVTLLERIPDGWKPDCNEYRHNIKIHPSNNINKLKA